MANIGKWILVILAIVVAALVLYSCVNERLGGLTGGTGDSVEINLQEIIPQSWAIQTGMGPDKCNFDDDPEEEQLLVYRYDRNAEGQGGLLGAVIYDSQVNTVPQEPGTESPYRPAFLVPYKLLPDFYNDKGQGYLGEGTIQVYPISSAEETRNRNGCQAAEINVAGTIYNGDLAQPNFLSVFRWGGESVGYVGTHFVGNARIVIDGGAGARIQKFITFNRLNDRSALCEAQPYTRQTDSAPNAVPKFQKSGPTIAFCFISPADPFYPEGVVVALLRNNVPPEGSSPTGPSYLTQKGMNELMAANITLPARILSIINPGAVTSTPDQGYRCPVQSLATAAAGEWWCAREQATVLTEVEVGGQPRLISWELISVANEAVLDDVHWRVDGVTLQ